MDIKYATFGLRERLAQFCADERGTATVDFVVFTSSFAALAVATAIDAMEAVDGHADDLTLCIKRQKNTLKNSHKWDYQTSLNKMQKRCGRI